MFKKSMMLNEQAMELLQTTLKINNEKNKKSKQKSANAAPRGNGADSGHLMSDLQAHSDSLNAMTGRKQKAARNDDNDEEAVEPVDDRVDARKHRDDSRAREQEEDVSPEPEAKRARYDNQTNRGNIQVGGSSSSSSSSSAAAAAVGNQRQPNKNDAATIEYAMRVRALPGSAPKANQNQGNRKTQNDQNNNNRGNAQ